MLVPLALLLVAGPPATPPGWRVNRDILRAVFRDPRFSGLDTPGYDRENHPTGKRPALVIPHVPAGTEFRVAGRVWKSVPWLTEAQRARGDFFEIESLSRRPYGSDDPNPWAYVSAFCPFNGTHVEATLLLANGVWRPKTLRAFIE